MDWIVLALILLRGPERPPLDYQPPPIEVLGQVGDFDITNYTVILLDDKQVRMKDVLREGLEITEVVVVKGRVNKLCFKTK